MTKTDNIGTTLRKLDWIWQKKSMTFCKAVKELMGGEFEDVTDDELIQRIKDITIDKESKE